MRWDHSPEATRRAGIWTQGSLTSSSWDPPLPLSFWTRSWGFCCPSDTTALRESKLIWIKRTRGQLWRTSFTQSVVTLVSLIWTIDQWCQSWLTHTVLSGSCPSSLHESRFHGFCSGYMRYAFISCKVIIICAIECFYIISVFISCLTLGCVLFLISSSTDSNL